MGEGGRRGVVVMWTVSSFRVLNIQTPYFEPITPFWELRHTGVHLPSNAGWEVVI